MVTVGQANPPASHNTSPGVVFSNSSPQGTADNLHYGVPGPVSACGDEHSAGNGDSSAPQRPPNLTADVKYDQWKLVSVFRHEFVNNRSLFLSQLNNLYTVRTNGQTVPYKEHGYPKLRDFLLAIEGLEVSGQGNAMVVTANEELIQRLKDDPSFQESSISNGHIAAEGETSGKVVPEDIVNKLRSLFEKYPDGIPASALTKMYHAHFPNEVLSFQELGFRGTRDLLAAIPQIGKCGSKQTAKYIWREEGAPVPEYDMSWGPPGIRTAEDQALDGALNFVPEQHSPWQQVASPQMAQEQRWRPDEIDAATAQWLSGSGAPQPAAPQTVPEASTWSLSADLDPAEAEWLAKAAAARLGQGIDGESQAERLARRKDKKREARTGLRTTPNNHSSMPGNFSNVTNQGRADLQTTIKWKVTNQTCPCAHISFPEGHIIFTNDSFEALYHQVARGDWRWIHSEDIDRIHSTIQYAQFAGHANVPLHFRMFAEEWQTAGDKPPQWVSGEATLERDGGWCVTFSPEQEQS